MADRNKDNRTEKNRPAEVYAEKAESAVPEIGEAEMKALASAYARYLRAHDLAPGDATFIEPENTGGKHAAKAPSEAESETVVGKHAAKSASQPVNTAAAKAAAPKEAAAKVSGGQAKKLRKGKYAAPDDAQPVLDLQTEHSGAIAEQKRKAAAGIGAAPAEPVVNVENPDEHDQNKGRQTAAADPVIKIEKPGMAAVSAVAAAEQDAADESISRKEKKRKQQARKRKKARAKSRTAAGRAIRTPGTSKGLAAIVELHDRLQDGLDEKAGRIGMDFAKGTHAIASTYRNSRRSIGIALLAVGVMAAALLIIFDYFTVYEYAYNGKILGYVKEQDEVTDVLDVAGKKLTQNSKSETGIEFVANQNITFNQVDARGKSTDDADTAVNKLIYLTDIETEAFGIYDGGRIVAVVKSSEEAEELLNRTMTELSAPDSGMELVSADFSNTLDIRPINVLLSSVQSSQTALRQMINGGNMETYHIAEKDETVGDIADMFGVEEVNIFNEDNSEIVTEIEQGDKVCVHSAVDPVSVEMTETGRLKEIIEYETIKKKSDEYYQGDTFVEQEGQNGTQIFEGTLTKVGGEVVDRQEKSLEVIKEKKDKIILIGTAERPKTAPTGTFAMPINTYVITSEFGGRWGRMHEGMDFGASTGTPIYASDGGTVLRATYYSGYGLCVDIDHENGRMTRYGHCSKLLVSAGDKVYQGQEIALVGNTGHSFGSHLHFEIRQNGTPQNPRNYLDL